MAQVFVTGGSGFIGRALVRRLVAEGHAVRALVRSGAAADTVAALGAQPVRGELTEVDTWSDATRGSEALFHLAAQTDIDADRAQHELVTVAGTRAALEAARRGGVPRFVHCGTEAALMAGDPLVDVDETAPLRPDSPAAYSATKAAAEQLVLDANDDELATIVIRPRFVWGPESSLTAGLVAAARAGQFAWVEGGRQHTDVTHVDNAVEGLVLGWLRGRPGEAYFVTDREPVVFRDFLQQLFEVAGVDRELPDVDAATAERLIPVPARWFLGQTCLLRTDKAVAELGYRPVVSHETGLADLRDRAAVATS